MIAVVVLLIIVILIVMPAIRLHTRTADHEVVEVEVCQRCGTTRTTIFDPDARQRVGSSLIMDGVRKRTYTYAEGYTEHAYIVCRSTGHVWPSRRDSSMWW